MVLEKLFGNATATKCLLFLARYEEGVTREISDAFKIPRAQVFIQLAKLENAGILSSRKLSNIRIYRLNPRSGISIELKLMLEKYIKDQMPQEKYKDFYLIRRRPRTKGKPLRGVYE